MGTILTESESKDIIDQLSTSERKAIERDKIRFGEYFIVLVDDKYFRINPMNVIVKNGVPELLKDVSLTFI
jgi:hypothetical protein